MYVFHAKQQQNQPVEPSRLTHYLCYHVSNLYHVKRLGLSKIIQNMCTNYQPCHELAYKNTHSNENDFVGSLLAFHYIFVYMFHRWPSSCLSAHLPEFASYLYIKPTCSRATNAILINISQWKKRPSLSFLISLTTS